MAENQTPGGSAPQVSAPTGRAAPISLKVMMIAVLIAVGGGVIAGTILVALGKLHPLYVISMVLQLATLVPFLGVWRGRRNDWRNVQFLFVVNLAAAVVVGLVKPTLLPAGFFVYVGIIVFWVWLYEPEIRGHCGLPEPIKPRDVRFTCPKCRKSLKPGLWECPACHVPLRPRLLDVLTLAAMPVIPALIVLMLVLKMWRSTDIALMVVCLLGLAAVVGLRYGRYWAWVAIQVLWGISLVLSFGRAAEQSTTQPNLMIGAAIQAAIILPLWFYLTRPWVEAFCSVGRGEFAPPSKEAKT